MPIFRGPLKLYWTRVPYLTQTFSIPHRNSQRALLPGSTITTRLQYPETICNRRPLDLSNRYPHPHCWWWGSWFWRGSRTFQEASSKIISPRRLIKCFWVLYFPLIVLLVLMGWSLGLTSETYLKAGVLRWNSTTFQNRPIEH